MKRKEGIRVKKLSSNSAYVLPLTVFKPSITMLVKTNIKLT